MTRLSLDRSLRRASHGRVSRPQSLAGEGRPLSGPPVPARLQLILIAVCLGLLTVTTTTTIGNSSELSQVQLELQRVQDYQFVLLDDMASLGAQLSSATDSERTRNTSLFRRVLETISGLRLLLGKGGKERGTSPVESLKSSDGLNVLDTSPASSPSRLMNGTTPTSAQTPADTGQTTGDAYAISSDQTSDGPPWLNLAAGLIVSICTLLSLLRGLRTPQ